jgi:hypothetical protein
MRGTSARNRRPGLPSECDHDHKAITLFVTSLDQAVIAEFAGLRLPHSRPWKHRCRPSTSPSTRACRRPTARSSMARTGVELLTSGELRVVDADGREVPSDAQTVGEIVVRGNVVMAGYYRDPEATRRAMGDGWFHTGDAAVVHPDRYVEIRDRLKDVIISGGENISSIEVEGVLLRYPAVQEAAIVGMPDEKWGETPRAFVVLRDGASATGDELIAFAREHLAHFKARAPSPLSASCRRPGPARSRSSSCGRARPAWPGSSPARPALRRANTRAPRPRCGTRTARSCRTTSRLRTPLRRACPRRAPGSRPPCR